MKPPCPGIAAQSARAMVRDSARTWQPGQLRTASTPAPGRQGSPWLAAYPQLCAVYGTRCQQLPSGFLFCLPGYSGTHHRATHNGGMQQPCHRPHRLRRVVVAVLECR